VASSIQFPHDRPGLRRNFLVGCEETIVSPCGAISGTFHRAGPTPSASPLSNPREHSPLRRAAQGAREPIHKCQVIGDSPIAAEGAQNLIFASSIAGWHRKSDDPDLSHGHNMLRGNRLINAEAW
jgi:hypothetical protein